MLRSDKRSLTSSSFESRATPSLSSLPRSSRRSAQPSPPATDRHFRPTRSTRPSRSSLIRCVSEDRLKSASILPMASQTQSRSRRSSLRSMSVSCDVPGKAPPPLAVPALEPSGFPAPCGDSSPAPGSSLRSADCGARRRAPAAHKRLAKADHLAEKISPSQAWRGRAVAAPPRRTIKDREFPTHEAPPRPRTAGLFQRLEKAVPQRRLVAAVLPAGGYPGVIFFSSGSDTGPSGCGIPGM